MFPLERPIGRRNWLYCAALSIALSLCWPARGDAEPQHELLLFTGIDTFNTSDESTPLVADSFERASIDILYSYSSERFRFLAEYLWASDESELERLKAGLQWNEDTMVWFGRIHTTSKHWTSEYHHGQFLQTSITRPSLEQWEDESGPIPSHVTGISIEHDRNKNSGGSFSYALSAGLAPRFEDHELMPFDMLDPRSCFGESINLKIAYRPEIFSPMQAGILLGWNDINVDAPLNPLLADVSSIDQLTVGVFADWQWDDWRVIADAVYFDNKLHFSDREERDDFVLSYVQAEYLASDNWTVFARTDNGFGEDRSPYLRSLPRFIAHRHMLGARWDFAKFQSLKFEVADTSAQGDAADHYHFKETRLQWSAVFP